MPKPEHLHPTWQSAAASASASASASHALDGPDDSNLRLLSRSPTPITARASSSPPNPPLQSCGWPTARRRAHAARRRGGGRHDVELARHRGRRRALPQGLPAPRAKPHKGLRGRNEALSGASTPLLSPTIPHHHVEELGEKLPQAIQGDRRLGTDRVRQARHVARRYVEVALLAGLGMMVLSNRSVQPLRKLWLPECIVALSLFGILIALYPLRLMMWALVHRSPTRRISLKVPVQFDPAPLLYPQTITVLTAFLLASGNPSLVLPNIMLCLCSIPEQLIPFTFSDQCFNTVHWVLTCVPLFYATSRGAPYIPAEDPAWSLVDSHHIAPGIAVLLYPLHKCLRQVLHHLTTTSLLPAELELFSIALINLLLLTSSPQMRILKALLWIGGLCVLVSCGRVIIWGIALARVPKWRFKREALQPAQPRFARLMRQLLWRKQSLNKAGVNGRVQMAPSSASIRPWPSSDDEEVNSPSAKHRVPSPFAVNRDVPLDAEEATLLASAEAAEPAANQRVSLRRNTFPFAPVATRVRKAALRKWIYAGYVYACIIGIVLLGIRSYISRFALDGAEAIGWALGYLLGNINWFRFQVVSENLDHWVRLPPRPDAGPGQFCHQGWVQHIRLETFGGANTRLLILGYWFIILVFGLVIVYRLKDIYEVDTRRKVFHFMMVGMLLPATYVDPAFAALALSAALASFLILDLLRASQLPPLSKPIANFLAPYVDGRDFRGPVVISHIFLLIGCAIAVADTGFSPAMVSGVICVGLGDAAASLIASAWLRVGRWPVTGGAPLGWLAEVRNAGVCASAASLTEAVLTGGNDNVIVPIVLWTCVKSLGV
ncbi:unnamed protein product [Parascedosporium putredinis]|uniref:dolichol kinase n=1 Tax=Parascedosporium putredinis TaxID=1442378 RepID=A0A9P1GUP5_9PEZI|nr:unnamed protein product [Parascedosporium putredinis]CAI7987374.1 unnamed protein product [Parascedosporium putredinis]